MPEFMLGSTLNSSSRMKSPYFFFVQRKELPVSTTVLPTTAPSSTRYSAEPLCCSQPSRSLPLKRVTHPSDWAWTAADEMQVTMERINAGFMVKVVTNAGGTRLFTGTLRAGYDEP